MDFSKLVLMSDLDGTLFNSECKISVRNKKAIQMFTENGGRFGISTGRTPMNSKPLIEGVCINTPSIVFNGSGLYDFHTETLLETFFLQKERLIPMITNCLGRHPNIDIQIYSENEINFVSPRETSDPDFITMHSPCVFKSLQEVFKENWLKILFCGEHQELEELQQEFKKEGIEESVHIVFSSEIFLEILPSGINKGSALAWLKDHLKEEHRVFCAVGDYYNDIELLKEADVAATPSNGVNAVKKLADQILVSNDEDAIADFIVRLSKL